MRQLFAFLIAALLLAGCAASAPLPEARGDPYTLAAELSSDFGITVLAGREAVADQPWDYILTAETDEAVLLERLRALRGQLQRYPHGMLRILSEDCGGLTICLVKEILGRENTESLSYVRGLQFQTAENNCRLAIALNQEYTLYHELFHVMEDFLLPRTSALDSWNSLNPPDFQYDYDYSQNASRDGSLWLQEDSRAFIDTYSMSFPREDRARILEYAMTEGNEALFRPPVMQEKLALLSRAIREAFSLQSDSRIFPWEQYLKTEQHR